MTDNIKRKKNTGEPTNNGGEFGSKEYAESEAALTAFPAMDKFLALHAVALAARDAAWDAAGNAITEAARAVDEDAAGVVFSWYDNADGGRLIFRGLTDTEGEPMPWGAVDDLFGTSMSHVVASHAASPDADFVRLSDLAGVFNDINWLAASPRFEPLSDGQLDQWDLEGGFVFTVGS